MVKPISEIRRDEIVDAAIIALEKHGLSNLSFDLIAEQAGTSRQLIRHYYPNSEDLMVEVCDHLSNVYREMMMVGITEFDQTQRLPLFLDYYFDLLSDQGLPKPRDDQFYDALFALACRSAKIKKNLNDQYTSLRQAFAIEVKVSHNQLSVDACDEIGYLFVSLMYGHWKLVANLGFSEDLNQVSRQAMDRLISSYLEHYQDPKDQRFQTPAP